MLTLVRYFELSFDSFLLCLAWGLWRAERVAGLRAAALFAACDGFATASRAFAHGGAEAYVFASCLAVMCSPRLGVRRELAAVAALSGFDNLLLNELPAGSPGYAAASSFLLAALGFGLGSRVLGAGNEYLRRHSQL